jgi:hypothetical protein
MKPLFTLRVAVFNDEKPIMIRAFDAEQITSPYGHARIDIEVKQGRRTIFKRGDTYCSVPKGKSMTENFAKELVMATVEMKPGDTDPEYFYTYTAEQLAFAHKYGEALSCERQFRYCDDNGNLL